MNQEDIERVDEELFDYDDDLVLYKGIRFTGIGYDPFPDGHGIEYETTYKNGLPHGLSKQWFDNGNLARQSERKMGMAHAKIITWFRNGELKSEATYEYGILIGRKCWNEQKELVEEFDLQPDSTNYRLLEERRRENQLN